LTEVAPLAAVAVTVVVVVGDVAVERVAEGDAHGAGDEGEVRHLQLLELVGPCGAEVEVGGEGALAPQVGLSLVVPRVGLVNVVNGGLGERLGDPNVPPLGNCLESCELSNRGVLHGSVSFQTYYGQSTGGAGSGLPLAAAAVAS
jgi:hypothetical protein